MQTSKVQKPQTGKNKPKWGERGYNNGALGGKKVWIPKIKIKKR